MSGASNARAADNEMEPFVYPTAQQVLYWLMKQAGYSKDQWPGDSSKGSVQRIAGGKKWVSRDLVKEFIEEVAKALLWIDAAENGDAERLLTEIMSQLTGWDRMADQLNNDPELELTAPLGTVPVLRIATIFVGCALGAIHALQCPKGDKDIRNPFAGGEFSGYLRRLLEATWPDDPVDTWATMRLKGIVSRNTLYEWLKNKPPKQMKKLQGLVEYLVQVHMEREAGVSADPTRSREAVEIIEWRMRLRMLLDRVGGALRGYFGDDYCDYYGDLEAEMVRTAGRSYSILTNPKYPAAELAHLSSMLATSDDDVRAGLVENIRQLMKYVAPSKPLPSTVEEARGALKRLREQIETDENARRLLALLLSILCLMPSMHPPRYRLMMINWQRFDWLFDYSAFHINPYPRLRMTHLGVTHALHQQLPNGLTRDASLRGLLMFAGEIDPTILMEMYGQSRAADEPPSMDPESFVASVNKEFDFMLRYGILHMMRTLGSEVSGSVLDHITKLGMKVDEPEMQAELALMHLQRGDWNPAMTLALGAIKSAPDAPQLWQLLVDSSLPPYAEILQRFLVLEMWESGRCEGLTTEMRAFASKVGEHGEKIAEAYDTTHGLLEFYIEVLTELDARVAQWCRLAVDHKRVLTTYHLHREGWPLAEERLEEMRDTAGRVIAGMEEEDDAIDGRTHERLAFLHMVCEDRKKAKEHAKQAERAGRPRALEMLQRT